MNRRNRALGIGCCVSAAALFLGACSTHDQVTLDPSPDLETLHQNSARIGNALTITNDENGRMFWQDLGRAAYWDRPSHLTREPVPR